MRQYGGNEEHLLLQYAIRQSLEQTSEQVATKYYRLLEKKIFKKSANLHFSKVNGEQYQHKLRNFKDDLKHYKMLP